MHRRDKMNYYLDIAQTVSERGTCLRRNFGAIIVKDDTIISTGYSGAPRGRKNCCDHNSCTRNDLKIPHGQRYDLCRSVHAEANAIIAAGRKDMLGGFMFLVSMDPKAGKPVANVLPCAMCKRLIINAGIKKIAIRDTADEYRVIDVRDWVFNDESLHEDLNAFTEPAK